MDPLVSIVVPHNANVCPLCYIHGDVYTVNSHLTCGVRSSDTQEVLHQSIGRREEAEQY